MLSPGSQLAVGGRTESKSLSCSACFFGCPMFLRLRTVSRPEGGVVQSKQRCTGHGQVRGATHNVSSDVLGALAYHIDQLAWIDSPLPDVPVAPSLMWKAGTGNNFQVGACRIVESP